MKSFTIILMSIFCSTHLSYSMHIIKKNNLPSHKENLIHYPRITAQELLFIKKITEDKQLPKDITSTIIIYDILLGNKNFEKTFPYIVTWHDFSIPLQYHHLLQQKEIEIMEKLFEYYIPTINSTQLQCKFIRDYNSKHLIYSHHYFLRKKEDYETFLKISIEIRQCLIKLPLSEQQISEQQTSNNPYFPYSLYGYLCTEKSSIIHVGKYKHKTELKPIISKEESTPKKLITL